MSVKKWNISSGHIYTGTIGKKDSFIGTTAGLNNTTIRGNVGGSDEISLQGAATVQIGNGTTGATITNVKELQLDDATNNITFANASTGITTVHGGSGNDTLNLANTGSTFLDGKVRLDAGNDSLTLEAGKAYTGAFGGGDGADTLVLIANAANGTATGSNISLAKVTGFENLVLSTTGGATASTFSMTAGAFREFSGAVTAPATETVILTTNGTVTGAAAIENYVLADGKNSFTGVAGLVSVIGGTGSDTLNVSTAILNASVAASGIDGGAGVDTLNVGTLSASVDLSGKVAHVERVNATAAANPAWALSNENGAGVTLNFTRDAIAGINSVTLGSGGQILNVLGEGTGSVKLVAGAGADAINLSTTATGADIVFGNSSIGAIDSVSNFKSTGADKFDTGVTATSISHLTIASADTANLATAIAVAATNAGAALASAGQAYLVTVASGTAAGTYVLENTGGNLAAIDATDFVIKLTGNTGTIVSSDFISGSTIALSSGQAFASAAGHNDTFSGAVASLSGSTLIGDAADMDVLTLTTAGTANLNDGAAGGTISNVKSVNLANGANLISFANATSGITTLHGSTGNDSVNLANTGTTFLAGSVELSTGSNALSLEGKVYTGSFTSGSGTGDTLAVSNGTDIGGATVTGFENLGVQSNGSITMTPGQFSQFTGTITGAGTETLNLAGAGSITANTQIEHYILANGTNAFTSANVAVQVLGGTGADTFNFTGNQIVNFLTSLDGGDGSDVLNIGVVTTTAIDLSAKVSHIETVNVAGSTGSAAFTNADGAGVVLNYTKDVGTNVIHLGAGGQTLHLLGASSAATTIAGGTGVDTFALPSTGGSAETIDLSGSASNYAHLESVSNFHVSEDFFKTGVQATGITTSTVASADTATLVAALDGVLSPVITASGEAWLITVSAGTAAGQYLFENTGSDLNHLDATDFLVQLTGLVGTPTIANLIV